MAEGSVGAFGALYDRYCSRAYGVAFSVCRDDGRAQDAGKRRLPRSGRAERATVSSEAPWPRGCRPWYAIVQSTSNASNAGTRPARE